MRLRPTAVLATLALALVATIQPAAAFTEKGHSGTYYQPQIMDTTSTPGVGCIYNNNAGTTNDTLKRIKVRQFFSHSPYHKFSYVGFQAVILRNGQVYDTTPLQKIKANDEKVAFFKASWTRPAGATGLFQVIVKLSYYNPQGVKKGSYKGRMDVYKQNLGTSGGYVYGDPGDPDDLTDLAMPGACFGEYQDIL